MAEADRLETLYQQALLLPQPQDDIWEIEDPQQRKEAYVDELCFDAAEILLRTVDGIAREAEPIAELTVEMFQTGSPRGSYYTPWTIRQFEQVVPESLRSRGEAIGHAMRVVMRQKGFLFSPATFTVEEHDAIGSTVVTLVRDRATDIPVNYVHQLLESEGVNIREGREHFTLEAIAKSRRLNGLPMIDVETGRVTGEIDEEAARDSYFFLNADETQAVQELEAKLLIAATDLYTESLTICKEALGIIKVLKAHAHGQVTTDELRQMSDFYLNGPGVSVELEEQFRLARQFAVEGGMLDPLLTPQEIMMRTNGKVDGIYLNEPYIPLAVQDGRLSAEEVDARRTAECHITQNCLLDDYDYPYCVALAELDEEGRTIQSPQLLDRYSQVPFTISDDFKDTFKGRLPIPFARPEDWYYEQN